MIQTKVSHPGHLLKQNFLDPLGITPYRLAQSIGVHVRRVSELVKGNRSMTPDTAIRLGLFFEVPARWWLEMQARYDSENPSRRDELRKFVKPYDKLEDVLITPKGVRILGPVHSPSKEKDSLVIGEEDLNRLKSQVRLGEPKTERKVRHVIYEDGTHTLVGTDS